MYIGEKDFTGKFKVVCLYFEGYINSFTGLSKVNNEIHFHFFIYLYKIKCLC